MKNPAIYNVEKLRWMNGVCIREMPGERLTERFLERLEQDLPRTVQRPIDRPIVARIAPLIRERVKLLSEVADYCDFFFVAQLRYSREDLLGKRFASQPDEARSALKRAEAVVEKLEPWEHERIEAAFRALADELAVKAGDLFSLIRVAVTGRRVTPPSESAPKLGGLALAHVLG